MAEEAEAEKIKMDKGGEPDDIVHEIGSVNPIADFTKMINTKSEDLVGPAVSQMQAMILKYLNTSLKGDLDGKAMECLKVLREGCVREDEGQSFNDFAI